MTIVLAVIAYLIGSVSFAVVVSRAMGMPDPRSYGSKNPGATNVLRTGKKVAAALTLLGDAGKLDVESVKREEIGPRVRRGEQDGKAAVGIAVPRDASYGVASLGLMQGPLASTVRIKRGPLPVPSPWRMPAPR